MWSKWKHSFSLYIHPYSKFGKIFEQLAIRMHKLIDKQIFCRGKQQCKGNAWGLASIYMYVSPLIPLLLLCMPYPLTISFLVCKNSVYSYENHWMVGNGCGILVNFFMASSDYDCWSVEGFTFEYCWTVRLQGFWFKMIFLTIFVLHFFIWNPIQFKRHFHHRLQFSFRICGRTLLSSIQNRKDILSTYNCSNKEIH